MPQSSTGPPRKARLVVNPTAGQEDATSRLTDLNARLRSRLPDLDFVMTVGQGDAEDAAADAAARGYTHVFAAGGDGTLNEVVNGVLRVPDALSNVVFGVVPLGTGNDFARALGLTADVDVAIGRLVDGRPRDVDLAFLDDRAFVNSSAAGLIAESSERVDSSLKSVAGRLGYLIGGAQAALEYQPAEFRLEIAGFPAITWPVQMMVVANAPTIGGGYALSPRARIDDGRLDLLVIKAVGLATLTALLVRLVRGDDLDEEDAVCRARFTELRFTCSRESTVNTDGAPRSVTQGRYSVRSRAARFLC